MKPLPAAHRPRQATPEREVDRALYPGAEAFDCSPRALRGALAAVLGQLRVMNVSLAEAERVVATVPEGVAALAAKAGKATSPS